MVIKYVSGPQNCLVSHVFSFRHFLSLTLNGDQELR